MTSQLKKHSEQERLRVKLKYLGVGTAIGALWGYSSSRRQRLVGTLAGALMGEMAGWVAHGLTQKRWFI